MSDSVVYVVSNTQQMSPKRFGFFYLQMFHLVTVAYEMSKTVKDWHFKTGFSDRPGVNRTVQPWQVIVKHMRRRLYNLVTFSKIDLTTKYSARYKYLLCSSFIIWPIIKLCGSHSGGG